MSLKILHFFPWTSWGSLGGTEKYITELVTYHSRNNEVFVAYPMLKQTGVRTIRRDSFTEIGLSDPNPNNSSLIGTGILPPKNLKEWKEILKAEKFDVIHFHCYEQYLLSFFIAAKRNSVKTVFTSHVVNFTCSNGTLINALSNRICDGTILVNRCTRCVLTVLDKRSPLKYITQGLNILIKKINFLVLKKFIDKTIAINENYFSVLLNNGFSKKVAEIVKPRITRRAEPGVNYDESPKQMENLKVVYIGRISQLKGVDVLLESFKNLSGSGISLHMYGPWGDIDIDQYISEHIHYNGVFAFDEVNTILTNYDVLCLPATSYEMMPLVIQEAINNGLYIIGTDVPGIRELITQGINGTIVPRLDSNALTQSLLEIKKNYKRNDPFIVESFQSISQRILQHYEDLCNKPGKE